MKALVKVKREVGLWMEEVPMPEIGPRDLLIASRREDGVGVSVLVEDSGVGLRPDNCEKIFDPFFTTKVNGTGMGLSISRSIVESHEGRLWARSRAGGGATFQFTIPVAEEARGA